MYKQVMLLGLLVEKPMYGQQIREVIENHHEVFANYIKKPTIYYQLDRLALDGYLEVRRETVEAPGPGSAHDELAPRERDVYYITEAGRQYFYRLLRESICSYTPGLNSVDASLFFLSHLVPGEVCSLLQVRYEQVASYKASVIKQSEVEQAQDEAHELVRDHKLTLLNAELDWLQRTIERLQTKGLKTQSYHIQTVQPLKTQGSA